MRALVDTVAKVLDHDASILILGESGTGKDYLAEAIHACGSRRTEPFLHIDCASIPPELFESELFGYERGTFTDASTRKAGKLEMARGGTVYFDGIPALTPNLQAKLLRALEERRFTRLGGNETITLAARVISSSSAGLASLLAGGAFRSDLLYRINIITLELPPLRERAEDIPALARRFLRLAASGRSRDFTSEAMDLLRHYSWPGNIRELRNVVERAALLDEGDRISADTLPVMPAEDVVDAAAGRNWTLEELEAHYIREILRRTRGNYSRAAQILGINRKTLLEKRRKYEIGD